MVPDVYRLLPIRRRSAQLGFDFSSLITGGANIASQINSLLTGSSTSAIYQPTTVPLTSGANLQNWLIPAAFVLGAIYLFKKK